MGRLCMPWDWWTKALPTRWWRCRHLLLRRRHTPRAKGRKVSLDIFSCGGPRTALIVFEVAGVPRQRFVQRIFTRRARANCGPGHKRSREATSPPHFLVRLSGIACALMRLRRGHGRFPRARGQLSRSKICEAFNRCLYFWPHWPFLAWRARKRAATATADQAAATHTARRRRPRLPGETTRRHRPVPARAIIVRTSTTSIKTSESRSNARRGGRDHDGMATPAPVNRDFSS